MKNLFDVIKYRDKHKIRNILVTIFGAFLYALGIKWFIIPAGLYTGGFTGIAQLISEHIYLSISAIWFILNIPVFYLGYKRVGRRFTFLSFMSVVFGALFLQFLPEYTPVQGNTMLNAITGGVISGIGVGITLKVWASTG